MDVAKLMRTVAAHFQLPLGDLLVEGDDRAFFHAPPEILTHLRLYPVWKPDVNRGRGHRVPCGNYKRIASFRSDTKGVSVQVCVHEHVKAQEPLPVVHHHGALSEYRPTREDIDRVLYVAEIDLDYSGLKHIGQVIGNKIKGRKSDPWVMAQLAHFHLRIPLPKEQTIPTHNGTGEGE